MEKQNGASYEKKFAVAIEFYPFMLYTSFSIRKEGKLIISKNGEIMRQKVIMIVCYD